MSDIVLRMDRIVASITICGFNGQRKYNTQNIHIYLHQRFHIKLLKKNYRKAKIAFKSKAFFKGSLCCMTLNKITFFIEIKRKKMKRYHDMAIMCEMQKFIKCISSIGSNGNLNPIRNDKTD